MWMLDIIKILFREKLKWTQAHGEQTNVQSWSPFQHLNEFIPLAYGAVFVLLAIAPSNVHANCTTPYVSRHNLQQLSWAINDLTFNLYRSMSTNSSDNLFFSPLSVASAFEMVFFGTRGETAKELRSVLGYNRAALATSHVHLAFRDLLCDFQSTPNSSLSLANAVLVNENLHVWPWYKSEMARLLQAYVRDVDFVGRDSRDAVREINDWVRNKTDGKITKLVNRLNSLTVMVLLNAVYFKGKWMQQFDVSDTKPKLFYNHGLELQAKDVPMMRLTHSFKVLHTREFQALELPYEGNTTSMIVLLPHRRVGLAQFERTLTKEKMAHVLGAMQPGRTRVVLPKFKFDYTREMSRDFRALGAHRIFEEGVGDFSGMTLSRFAHVSGVLHKVSVEVGEEGSEAAAGTGVVMASRSMPLSFVADHPFLFAIVDKGSGVFIMMGRVTNL